MAIAEESLVTSFAADFWPGGGPEPHISTDIRGPAHPDRDVAQVAAGCKPPGKVP